jgi:hypothetical protein
LGRLVVNVADCYPTPDVAPFPENPTGVLARILSEKKIRVGSYIPAETGSTGIHFEANGLLLEAIMGEVEQAYGLDGPIEIERVIIDPPSSTLLYNALNDGTIDITDLFSALGGSNFGTLRRKFALFSCTVLASGWFLHVRNESPYSSVDDFRADSSARLCNVIMSTHLSRAYFPEQEKEILIEDDIELCSQGVLDGLYDAYLHFDPVPAKIGLRSIDTGIVSGTPVWVAGDSATDPSPPEPVVECPVARTLKNPQQLNAIRALRDAWFKNKAMAHLVLLYYENDLEVSMVLARDATLSARFASLLSENIDTVNELLAKGTVTMPRSRLAALTAFLRDLKHQASPKLNADIDAVLKGIAKGQLLKNAGIATTE